jgi:hypothetical protein
LNMITNSKWDEIKKFQSPCGELGISDPMPLKLSLYLAFKVRLRRSTEEQLYKS